MNSNKTEGRSHRRSNPKRKQVNRNTKRPNIGNYPNKLKLCTLAGTTEVGRNCNFVEFGEDILMIDCGFSFPGHELYGIDYLIPNIKYLKKNKKRIRGILITHGHLDHTGALPYVLPELDFPPIYAGRFANALIKERLKEFELDKRVKTVDVHRNTNMRMGNFNVQFIGVTHSIPNSFSIFIKSPKGNIYFTGDYKIDTQPENEPETDYSAIKKLRGKVDLALMESTNAHKEGKAKPAQEVARNIEKLVRDWNGRVIVAAFSSLVSRQYSLVKIAEKLGKKIAISGRSLRTSMKIARELGYIRVPEKVFIPEPEINKYPSNQVIVLCTGSQGERYGALNRISLKEHKFVHAKKGDLVMMSASEIPPNVPQIQEMTDRLIMLGVELIQGDMEKIYESGHALQTDMKMMYELIQPKNVMPVHGSLTQRYKNKTNLVSWGAKEQNVLLTDDGLIWEFNNNSWKRRKKIESKPVMIDGLGVGDIGDIVIKDRRQLAEYGMVCVILNLSSKAKKLIGRPYFVSRGFVYVKASKTLMNNLETIVKDVHNDWHKKSIQKKRFEEKLLRARIEESLSKYIYKETEREPMILPVVV